MFVLKNTEQILERLLVGIGLDRVKDEFGAGLRLQFELPAGCYATAVLREVLKGPNLERSGAGRTD